MIILRAKMELQLKTFGLLHWLCLAVSDVCLFVRPSVCYVCHTNEKP